jgi:hypothetical protein
MDPKKIDDTSILIFVWIMASGVLLISGFWIYSYGFASLMNYRTGGNPPGVIFGFVLVMLIIVILYSAYQRITGRSGMSIDPGLQYPCEGELELGIPFDQAFHLSRLAVQLLPSVTITDADPGTGTIHADAETLSAGHSKVTLTLEKKGANVTRVRIHSLFPLRHRGRTAPLRFTGQNKQIVNTLTNYLREQSQRTDNSVLIKTQSNQAHTDTYLGDLHTSWISSPEPNPCYKNPEKAAVLSLVLPGLGQAYNGRSDEGAAIALGTGMCLMIYIIPGILVWAYGVYYAYTTAQRMNRSDIPFRPGTAFGMICVAGFALVCLAAAYHVIALFGLPGLVTFGLDPVGTCMRMQCI